MSYYVDIRFRPIASLNGDSTAPVDTAIERWNRLAPAHDGFVGLTVGVPAEGPPEERPTAKMFADVTPVDLRTEWASFDAAAAFYSDKSMWEYLCGVVACAPAARWEGFD
jgi:hypothetical protein